LALSEVLVDVVATADMPVAEVAGLVGVFVLLGFDLGLEAFLEIGQGVDPSTVERFGHGDLL
jgi:hypothetical protein